MAVKISIPAINELTDASLSEETENQILDIISSVDKVENVHNLKTRRSGPCVIIDAHIVVDPMMNVYDAHQITVQIEKDLYEQFGYNAQISIHVEPHEDAE